MKRVLVDELAQAPAKPQWRGVDRDVDVRRLRGRKALLDRIEVTIATAAANVAWVFNAPACETRFAAAAA